MAWLQTVPPLIHNVIQLNMKHIIRVFFLYIAITSCTQTNTSSDHFPPAPEGMVYIPAGTFRMGGKSAQASPDELPRRNVAVSAFFIDAHEVTNRQFAAFVQATDYVTVAERAIDWEVLKLQLPPGTPKPDDAVLQPGSLVFTGTEGAVDLQDYSQWWTWTTGANWRQPEGPGSSIEDRMEHPVVHIAWEDAMAYANWAGKRLPTEAEWEWAAMGGLDDPKYPWGNQPAQEAFELANFWQGAFPYINTKKDGYETTAPVKSFPANQYGLFDMAGNVWEWCSDKYNYDAYSMTRSEKLIKNPQGPDTSFDPMEPTIPKRTMRGGSFLCDDSYCSGYRVARRMKSSEDSSFNHTGFRCVMDVQ